MMIYYAIIFSTFISFPVYAQDFEVDIQNELNVTAGQKSSENVLLVMEGVLELGGHHAFLVVNTNLGNKTQTSSLL